MKNLKNILVVVGLLIVSGVFLTGCAVGGATAEAKGSLKFGLGRGETIGASVKRNTSTNPDGTKTTELTLGAVPGDDKYRLENRDPLR